VVAHHAHLPVRNFQEGTMAKSLESARLNLRHMFAALGATAALALAAGNAQAQGVPGINFYIGAGVGQSNADTSLNADFDKKDTAWKVYGGVRALSFLGAELNYIDFGKPKGGGDELKYKGFAGYGLYYLPLPLPILDVYVKAGVARIDIDVPSTDFSTDDTKFAYGAGVQLKFSSFAIRAEFEQFKIEGTKPSLLSLGFSKSFL
jgi:opacity protein-like surface antigen